MKQNEASFYPLMFISSVIVILIFDGYFWITNQLVSPEDTTPRVERALP